MYEKQGRLFFINKTDKGFREKNSDLLVNKIKLLLKRVPWLFTFFYYALGSSFVGRSASAAIKNIGSDKLIVNLGSGVKIIRDDVVNIDFYPFLNVDVVADISDLPFADNSIDVAINEYVLEHVHNPEQIVREMYRILKPGGVIYVVVPFVASFHSSPNDFYRWSKPGLKELLKDFEEVESGIRSGPTSALTYVISEWLATVLSFGINILQQFWFILFLTLLAPLNFLDYIIYKLPSSQNIAYGFYFIGKK